MSHDKNGNVIKVGDIVILELEVKTVEGDENFCSMSGKTVLPMPGNGLKSFIYAISTRQVLLKDKKSEG